MVLSRGKERGYEPLARRPKKEGKELTAEISLTAISCWSYILTKEPSSQTNIVGASHLGLSLFVPHQLCRSLITKESSLLTQIG